MGTTRIQLAVGLLLTTGLVTGASSALAADVMTANPNPQYLVLHKTDTGGAPNCWYQQSPDSFSQDGVDEILQAIGTRGNASRKLAVGYSFSCVNNPPQSTLDALSNMLELSRLNDLPVVIHLDGVNWWGERPDLWNWWDPDLPGYDPANVGNVEWYDWGSEHAVKLGWRNWGSQFRVPPQPNIASPALLAVHEAALREPLALIAEWYGRLPVEKQYLLGGVVMGWEISPYVQFYFYPDGNRYVGTDPADDPKAGIAQGVPLGYAGAAALGRAHSGPLTNADIDAVCAYYTERITGVARAAGLPRAKIIAHNIIFPGTKGGGAHSGVASLTPNAIPGWSFYDMKPSAASKLLAQLDGTPWAAAEFQSWGLSASLLESFYSKGCRYIDIYNWESIYKDATTIRSLQKTLAKDPGLLASSPSVLKAEVSASQVELSWLPGQGAGPTRVQVSTSSKLTVSGLLANPDVVDQVATAGQARQSLTLPAGSYSMVIVDTDGKGGQLASEVLTFSVGNK